MSDKPLLIAGIDPGATVGYSLLDLKGNAVKIDSAKELDLDSLISRIISIGRPIAVGCDKAKVPFFVEKFAARLGLKVICPPEDLRADEKRIIANKCRTKNSHELDALASSLFAFRQFVPLFKKIDKFIAGKGNSIIPDEHLSAKVKEIVIKKGISIIDALKSLEPEAPEEKIIKKATEQKILSEKDFISLHEEVKKLKKDNSNLKEYNKRLKDAAEKISREKDAVQDKMHEKLGKILSKERKAEKMQFRERKISFLGMQVKSKEQEIKKLNERLGKIFSILPSIADYVMAKRLGSLGWNEFLSKDRVLNIRKNDILLVDNPNMHSEKTLEKLRGVVDIIVCKTPASKKLAEKLAGFVFIDAKKLKIQEQGPFAFIDRASFERERKNRVLLKNLVEEYQTQRAILRTSQQPPG